MTTVAGFASTVFVPLTASVYAYAGRERTVLLLALFVAIIVIPLNATLPKLPLSDARIARIDEAPPVGWSPPLASLTLVFALQAFASSGTTVHLVSLLRDRGHEVGEAAVIAGLVGAAQVPARLAFGPFQRLAPARARLPILFGAQAVAAIALLVRSPSVAILAVVVTGAANGLVTLERATVIARAFGVERYGEISGRMATFAQLSRAASPFLVGMAAGAWSYDVALAALACITGASSAIAWTAFPPSETSGSQASST
ncbi:MAG: hypothetical protein JST00_31335 [Deltaproteobacteria bacterium]|nr:hypothetical protein [Deltaproteobacteria bacterium]